MNRVIALLEENNKMLKEIRALLFMQAYDSDYINQQDMKAFCINIVADIFVDMMKTNKEFRTKMENNFRKHGPVHNKNGKV